MYGELRSHQGEPSVVIHRWLMGALCWFFVSEFMAPAGESGGLPEINGFFGTAQSTQPLNGRVTSTIQFGALRDAADLRKVSQSWRLRGEKSFVPLGQLFFARELETSKQLEHLTIEPGDQGPFIVTRSHLHVEGLPTCGVMEMTFMAVHSKASSLPFASVGNGTNSAFL
jgi:hypothetical protein